MNKSGEHFGWTFTKVGKLYTFRRTVTLDGTTDQTVTLPFPVPDARSRAFQLNLVSLFYNDTTVKNHELRIYSSNIPSSYTARMTVTADANQPHSAQFGAEYRYPLLNQIAFVWTGTNSKTCDVEIVLEEL